jgi:hypothetical protein
VNLLLLAIVCILLSLQLIADQRAGAQPKTTADRCTGTRMAHGRADQSTGCCAAKSTDAGAFFPG